MIVIIICYDIDHVKVIFESSHVLYAFAFLYYTAQVEYVITQLYNNIPMYVCYVCDVCLFAFGHFLSTTVST